MIVREMHYDLKQKLNKIDSQSYRNLKVPEIDWRLNEAQDLFVKIIAEPRLASQFGFEKNQRTIDDIRTIVVNQSKDRETCIVPTVYDEISYIASLPTDYWFHVDSKVYADKGSCINRKLTTIIRQHSDRHEESEFDKSSFEWGECNIRFIKDGIRIFTDGNFTIKHFCMDYIKVPVRIHNAQDFIGGTYNTLDGTTLTGFQNCELPEKVHTEIVDLAVMLISGDLAAPDFNIKQNKIQLNN